MYVREKKVGNHSGYYQLVESRRVDGQPRQKVLMHLGPHDTVEKAMRAWSREVIELRRKNERAKADELEQKLEKLQGLVREARPRRRGKK